MRTSFFPASLLVLSLSLALLLGGCYFTKKETTPIEMVRIDAQAEKTSDTLFIVLPGMMDEPKDFVREGFFEILHKEMPDADAIAVDAHFKYYKNRTLLTRLKADVIEPARAKGYRKIWLMGVSMGGLGSLLYLQKHADTIDGVFVLAPFLGKEKLTKPIREAKGLEAWQCKMPECADAAGKEDYLIELWHWLKTEYFPHIDAMPPLYLGYGTEDKFATANELLARELPAERVLTTSGGHDWPPWRMLWTHFLDGQKEK